MLTMLFQNDLFKARTRSIFLALIMLLSTTAALATTASASLARTYTTNRDPTDVAIGDFDCDGFNDLAVATDGTHSITILWNDGNGDFSERQDIWVAGNQSRNADWDEFANVEQIEVGEFTGDSAPDLAIYQKNNPFKTNDQGAPAGEPGNMTIIENGGCGSQDWSIGERFTHFWVWDMTVGDADQDGNDDIYVLDLMADITTQRVVTYRGPITSSTQGGITNLGAASSNTFRSIEVGDFGDTQTSLTGSSCTDDDIWLLRSEGLDYSTGTVTTPGNDDNVSIIEFDCLTQGYPLSYTYGSSQANTQIINMQTVTSEDFSIADIGGNGYIDTLALNDGNLQNVTYSQATAQGTFGIPQLAYFGPYISWSITVEDLNGDGEPDFVNPTIAYQQNQTDSAGGSTSNYFLNFPSTVQVTLSDGNGGHVSPLSYETGRRPSAVAIGQMAGGQNSAEDIVIGHTEYAFGGWRDNFGWLGQYDTLTIIEMDNKDLAVTGLEISPVDRFFGLVGEGTRDMNITVTNTGMDTLNGQTATLDVELKIVDEANSSNTTVYSNDWDSAEDKTGCGTGCGWTFEEYFGGTSKWHLETNHSTGSSSGNNDPNVSANHLNPTDFMWAGEVKTNQSGDDWTGYGKNWDDGMVLNNVDLTNADRAFMSVELFQHLGWSGLYNTDQNGNPVLADVWDDLAIVEIGSIETGWTVIGCPQQASLQGACLSGTSFWGGYDNDRFTKENILGNPAEVRYTGTGFVSGTYYGWSNFTEEGFGAFDLSSWAGEEVDIRFRFRTGFGGSIADDNESRWSGRDGFAVDNLTIWKQTTTFLPNPTLNQTTIQLTNLEPGQEYTTSIQADLLNDTTYRISATLSGNTWDEQSLNDDVTGYVTPFNLYDPAVEYIDFFKPGGLYAQGLYDISATTNNWGNTAVDFGIEATVYSATPSDIYCGTPSAVCVESFGGGAAGYRYEETGETGQAPLGAIYTDATCSTKIFNSNAYWFGHPCDTGSNGYNDDWTNETLTIPDIDLTSMSGDFVSLNFEYYADTFYSIDQNGNIDPSDAASMWVEFTKNVGQTNETTYEGLVIAQWNDYNEDGTCRVDSNDDGVANETEPRDFAELDNIGDSSTTDGSGGNYEVFFNTDDLVKTTSIDLTHLYILNTTGPSTSWTRECISLQGTMLDVNFIFNSDEDGRNGVNDGFKGVGFNNISLSEYTFVSDATYDVTRTNVDAGDIDTTTIASHEFNTGVYRLDVKAVFDNTTAGKPWFNDNELSSANNIQRVIFNVESVDVSIGKPNTLTCHTDQTLPCVLPIDSALTHSWEFQATNGVLGGDYVFFMDVVDMADGSIAHSVSSGPSVTLESQEKTQVSFTPWNGWIDGHTYNISFYGELADGSETGNIRSFQATFANNVDIAILSDTSARTTAIKEDIAILGMTYTQFAINDWDTYFDAGWFTHYDKIILPWQDTLAAKDTQFSGDGYYQYLGEPARRTILENFMSAGGTVQAHLAPHGSQIYGLDQGLQGRLPFGLDIKGDPGQTQHQVTYQTMDLADPFHPIMDNIDVNAFQGFDANSGVAQAVLNTKSVSTTNVPETCDGFMENGGYFQRLIRSSEDIQDTVLGVCSYYSGGLIVSTIDVATHSERADSATFPLMGNLLSYKVTPYPTGFGTLGNGLDLTINGDTPEIDPSTSKYALRYMKSDATLDFAFTTQTTETLHADWVISGPTNWDGTTLATGVTGHISEQAPSMFFCKADLASATGCAQGEQWDITLMLHDDAGHARTIHVTVETNDVYADEYRPVASAKVESGDNVEYMGSKTVSNVEWDVNRIILDQTGEAVIQFDAGNSSDQDSLEGNGIETYEWKVLFDAPYGDDSFDLDGHTFTQTAASDGEWSYEFKNKTVDETGTTENQIRIELVVYDSAGKFSEKYRMYFVVVDEGYGDEEPVVQWDTSLNNTKVDTDEITISGQVLSGSEEGDVYIEAAFYQENFTDTSVRKYNLSLLGLYDKSDPLGDAQTFELSLKLESLYTADAKSQRVFIKIYEGEYPNERWVTIKWIEIDLPACQGLEADPEAEAAGGEFILDENGDCQWSGDWVYDSEKEEWRNTSTGGDAVEGESDGISTTLLAISAIVLFAVIALTMLFMRKDSDKDDMFDQAGAGFGAAASIDPTEQYVQQLIAQGYPEETARAFAAQYVGAEAAAQPAAAQPAAAQPAAAQPAAGYDQAVYEQYYQQFTTQGYDAATAAAYAQQYAVQYAQSQQ